MKKKFINETLGHQTHLRVGILRRFLKSDLLPASRYGFVWVGTSFFQTNKNRTQSIRGFQSLTAVHPSTLYNLLKTLDKTNNRRARSDEGWQGLLRISLLTCCGPVQPSA